MKLVITGLLLALPTTVISNNLNSITQVEQKSPINLKTNNGAVISLRDIRTNVLWYVERHGHGWTPFYNIDFTRKFFVEAIKYLDKLEAILNNGHLINEKKYNKISSIKLSEDKNTKVQLMSFGYWTGIAVTGPMCLDLKNRFWNAWEPVFNTIEQVLMING